MSSISIGRFLTFTSISPKTFLRSTALRPRHLHTMAASTDAIQSKLFAREPPALEPGTKVWDESLVDQIAGLKEHRFVVAGEPSDVLHTPRLPAPAPRLLASISPKAQCQAPIHQDLVRQISDHSPPPSQ